MTKTEIQEMLYEYAKSSDKTLSNFMNDVTNKLSEEPKYFTLHQEEDRENFRKLFEGIEDIKEHLRTQDERSERRYQEQREFMLRMTPVEDGLRVAQGLNKFFKWIGLPGLVVFFYWLFSKS